MAVCRLAMKYNMTGQTTPTRPVREPLLKPDIIIRELSYKVMLNLKKKYPGSKKEY